MSETIKHRTWDKENLAFEAWKHCSGIGGSDKDRMVQIVTWMLGFSAAIIGFQAKGGTADLRITIFGVVLSLVAAGVALLYGAYAAWNWAIADEIAEAYCWRELLPEHDPTSSWQQDVQVKLVRWLARPCRARIAPIFWGFFAVSIVSAVFHLALLWRAI